MLPTKRHREVQWKAQARRLVLPSLSSEALVSLVTRPFLLPQEVFALAKQIDGDPDAYGSYPLAGIRANIYLQQRLRQPF